jgi:hypothetical protein
MKVLFESGIKVPVFCGNFSDRCVYRVLDFQAVSTYVTYRHYFNFIGYVDSSRIGR